MSFNNKQNGVDFDRLQNDLDREGLEIASVSKRVMAYIIDWLLIVLVVNLMFNKAQSDSIANAYDTIQNFSYKVDSKINVSQDDMKALLDSAYQAMKVLLKLFFIYGLFEIIYNALFTYRYGATIGKIIMRIKVVDLRIFDRPSFVDSLFRSFFKYLLGTSFYISFIFAFVTKYKTALHDKISKTIVVNS